MGGSMQGMLGQLEAFRIASRKPSIKWDVQKERYYYVEMLITNNVFDPQEIENILELEGFPAYCHRGALKNVICRILRKLQISRVWETRYDAKTRSHLLSIQKRKELGKQIKQWQKEGKTPNQAADLLPKNLPYFYRKGMVNQTYYPRRKGKLKC